MKKGDKVIALITMPKAKYHSTPMHPYKEGDVFIIRDINYGSNSFMVIDHPLVGSMEVTVANFQLLSDFNRIRRNNKINSLLNEADT